MRFLGIWFKGILGSCGLMVGVDNLTGIFQPKVCHDSVFSKCGLVGISKESIAKNV